MNENRKLRWGILGCAGIAKRAFIHGVEQSVSGTVAAIASRDEAKAKETAEQFGIPTYYGSYEALLRDDSLDAVYIPLPNHLHKEWTIRAAEHGKHVLCEKPIALNAEEAKEMAAACEQAGVQLAEAFMYRHHPRYTRIKEIIKSGEIGTVRNIQGTFTFNNAANGDNVRFHKRMGGGSLYDLGVYPISAARYILEAEPEAATVHVFYSREHDDVDMMAAGLLEFADSVALSFVCSMWASHRNFMEILGTEGRIEVPNAYGSNAGSNLSVITGAGERKEDISSINHFTLQAEDFATVIFANSAPRFGPQDAVKNMRVVDACQRSARERARITI